MFQTVIFLHTIETGVLTWLCLPVLRGEGPGGRREPSELNDNAIFFLENKGGNGYGSDRKLSI